MKRPNRILQTPEPISKLSIGPSTHTRIRKDPKTTKKVSNPKIIPFSCSIETSSAKKAPICSLLQSAVSPASSHPLPSKFAGTKSKKTSRKSSPVPRLRPSSSLGISRPPDPQSKSPKHVSHAFLQCCSELRQSQDGNRQATATSSKASLSSEHRTGLTLTRKLIETNPFCNWLVKNFLGSRHRDTIFKLVGQDAPFRLNSDLGYAASLYSIKELVGAGTFGHVFLSEQLFTGQKVALKAIQKTCLAKFGLFRLENELRVLRMFRWHPHIVHLIDYFETPTHVYLVFEYLQGGDLFKFFSTCNGEFKPMDSRMPGLLRQVASAVADLHDRKVAHYDLKPDNILVDSRGNVKLADFGISQILDQSEKPGKTGGTLIYSAPEMVLGLAKTTQSDIWGLGVLTYYLAFGQVPFEPTEDGKVAVDNIVAARYRFPLVSHRYALVKDLIQRTLVTDPAARPTAREVLAHPFLKTPDTSIPPPVPTLTPPLPPTPTPTLAPTNLLDKRRIKLATNGFRLFLRTLRWMHGHEDFADTVEADAHFQACVAMMVKNASI